MSEKPVIVWPEGKVPTSQEKELAQKIVGQMGEIDWGEFDRQVAQKMPPRPLGLRTTKSRCCNATVVTVGRGLLRQVCLACGKEHHAGVYR
jgi:hypothetical protein